MTAMERWEKKVAVSMGCWTWIGAASPKGYGLFWNGSRLMPAHRWGYERLVGPIPEGLELDHLCRNRKCVRPDHLEPVTHRENTLRGSSLMALNAVKTHCKYGHEFTPENTGVATNRGGRKCKTCNRARAAQWGKDHPEIKRAQTLRHYHRTKQLKCDRT